MNILHHALTSVPSTQTWSKDHLHWILPDTLLVASAEEQTQGYGRRGHRWESPKGESLSITFGFRFNPHRTDRYLLAELLSLSAIALLQQWNFHPSFKPPNDLLIGGKKVAGALCETTTQEGVLFCFAGLGINLTTPEQKLAKIGQPVTSLSLEGAAPSMEEATQGVIDQFNSDLRWFLTQPQPHPEARLYRSKEKLRWSQTIVKKPPSPLFCS